MRFVNFADEDLGFWWSETSVAESFWFCDAATRQQGKPFMVGVKGPIEDPGNFNLGSDGQIWCELTHFIKFFKTIAIFHSVLSQFISKYAQMLSIDILIHSLYCPYGWFDDSLPFSQKLEKAIFAKTPDWIFLHQIVLGVKSQKQPPSWL